MLKWEREQLNQSGLFKSEFPLEGFFGSCVKNTNFILTTDFFWYHISDQNIFLRYKLVEFDYVFENSPVDVKEKFLFYLNILKKKG